MTYHNHSKEHSYTTDYDRAANTTDQAVDSRNCITVGKGSASFEKNCRKAFKTNTEGPNLRLVVAVLLRLAKL